MMVKEGWLSIMANKTLIGPYSAYAIAVKHGYQGTEAEWAKTLIDAGNNAASAAESKTAAAQSAENAATSEANVAHAEERINTAVSGAVEAVTAQETKSVQAVAAQGEASVAAVTAEGERVLGTIPADYTTLSNGVSQLKDDIVTKLDKNAVGETELKFTNSGYVRATDGVITESPSAQNTGLFLICGVSKIIAHVNLSDAGAKIAFFSGSKEYLKDISVVSGGNEEIELNILSDDYKNAKYCIVSNYGSDTKIAKVIGIAASIDTKADAAQAKADAAQAKADAAQAKADAAQAKADAAQAISPARTTFFTDVNLATTNFVKNTNQIAYNDGIVNANADAWSLKITCEPNSDYYVHIPDRNRKNAVESETGEFINGETYTLIPVTVESYNGIDVLKITTGENAKAIMLYYMYGVYDYEANKNKIVIVKDKWTQNPYAHIPSKYLPKELFSQSKHYGTFSIIGDS